MLRAAVALSMVWALLGLALASQSVPVDAQSDTPVTVWVSVQNKVIKIGKPAVFVFTVAEPVAENVTFDFTLGRNFMVTPNTKDGAVVDGTNELDGTNVLEGPKSETITAGGTKTTHIVPTRQVKGGCPFNSDTRCLPSTAPDAVNKTPGDIQIVVTPKAGYRFQGIRDGVEIAGFPKVDVWGESTTVPAQKKQPPTPLSEVSITAGSDVTEGGDATFTLTADPAPAQNLVVNVTVAADGDFGVTAGTQTVTIPTTGTYTLTVPTTQDTVDEPDGSVTVTVDIGDYTVSSSAGSAKVAISDDDPPELSIVGGSATEGDPVDFCITSTTRPTADLSVSVTVAATTGDFGVVEGKRTWTFPQLTVECFEVDTTDDDTDEPDGEVTVTLNNGTGYTVSQADGAAVGAILDNDDAPAVPEVSVVVVGSASVTEGGQPRFKVSADPAPSSDSVCECDDHH